MSNPAAEEYQVLNLKYRPKLFSEVVGQRSVVRQLQGEIRDGRVGHAYLFSGPRGVGKTSMARIFAKALNCVQGPTADPCGVCMHCVGISTDSDLDVVEVDAATHTQKDETIELLRGIDRVAFNARYKVYIIDEVHMFSKHSFNVLLKRLEEPPPNVVFILATTNPENIPQTVLSRCRKVDFERMDVSDIVSRLAEIADREGLTFVDGEKDRILEAIALASEGGMRDAQVALDQLISLSDGALGYENTKMLLGVVESDVLRQLLESLVRSDSVRCLKLVHELVEKGRDLSRFVKVFSSYLRDAMLLKANAPVDLLKVSKSQGEELRQLIEPLSMASLLNMMQQFLDLEEKLRGAAPPRFVLEFTLLKLTAIHPTLRIDSAPAPPPPAPVDPSPEPTGRPAPSRTAPPGGGSRAPSWGNTGGGARALATGMMLRDSAAEEKTPGDDLPEIEFVSVAEEPPTREARIVEMPPAPQKALMIAEESLDEEDHQPEIAPVQPLSPPMTLEEAMRRYPNFRAAIEIAREHLGVDPHFCRPHRAVQ